MPLVARLPLLPPGAQEVGDSLAILEDGERIVFFNAAGPIFSCRRDDRTSLRLGAVTVVGQRLAGATAVAKQDDAVPRRAQVRRERRRRLGGEASWTQGTACADT